MTGLLLVCWAAPLARAGEIVGTVHLDGPVPSPMIITIEPKDGNHSTAGCGSLSKTSPRLLLDARGGIQNAVVWLEAAPPLQTSDPDASVVLDQRDCVFSPHVLVVPPGGRLAIRNSDAMLHNVRIFHEVTMLMHAWQPAHGDDLVWRFDSPGRYLVRCGVHAWMYAWVIAADHAYYAVTDAAGNFRLSGVPAGRSMLRIWHETLGEQQQVVRVGERQTDVAIRWPPERRASWE